QLAGDGRLVLFGHPTLEILSRKMLQFGCDDYIVTPPNPAELQQMFGSPPLRLTGTSTPDSDDPSQASAALPAPIRKLTELPLADIFLEAMLQYPHDAPAAAVKAITLRIVPELELRYGRKTDPPVEIPEGRSAIAHPIRVGSDELGTLHLLSELDVDELSLRRIL